MLNNALSDYFNDIKSNNESKKEYDQRIVLLSKKIKDLTEDYKGIDNKYGEMKLKLDEQNESATNDEPLLKIKKTINDLRVELTKIDIRIGVLNNCILNKKFREKRSKLESTLHG